MIPRPRVTTKMTPRWVVRPSVGRDSGRVISGIASRTRRAKEPLGHVGVKRAEAKRYKIAA